MTQEEISHDLFMRAFAPWADMLDYVSIGSWDINLQQNEPEIVRDYLLNKKAGVDYLNHNFAADFSRLNPRFSLKFASVFIHGRPKVYWATDIPSATAKKSCELGDLCLIFMYVDAGKNVRFARALIAQAKKEWYLDSEDQRALYDEASKFNYAAKIFYSQTYDKSDQRLLPSYVNGRSLGLKYLLLPPHGPEFISAPAASFRHQGWGSTLFRMAACCEGLPFTPGAPKSDVWSGIMDDIIKMGRNEIKSSSKNPIGRAQPSDLDYVIEQFNHFENFDHFSISSGDDNEERQGVPMLLMIVQDKELATLNNNEQ